MQSVCQEHEKLVGSKGYFNPRLKRISPSWVAAKNAVKQKLKFKGGDQVKYSESPGNQKRA